MGKRQRGFVLIAMSVALLLMLAMVGLAFDFGRIYIARNEAQVFTDAAAMAAAKALGAGKGLFEAREAVKCLPNRWNLGSREFKGVVVEFSADGSAWAADPEDAAAAKFARVTAPANDVEITFLRAVGGPQVLTVPARSVAAASDNVVRLVQ